MESLEDFEKHLASKKKSREERRERDRKRHKNKDSDRGGHISHHYERFAENHRSKRSRHNYDGEDYEKENKTKNTINSGLQSSAIKDGKVSKILRDDWMVVPPAIEFDNLKKKRKEETEIQQDQRLIIHKKELNHSLLESDNKKKSCEELNSNSNITRDVFYTFGDAGSQWRMTKLKALYRQAEKSGRSIDEVAIERYGDLQDFDDAREEEIEMERRKVFGDGYLEKKKPSGELFRQRKSYNKLDNTSNLLVDREIKPPSVASPERKPIYDKQTTLDSTALNRMRAQLIKAKMKKSADVEKLEDNYNKSVENFVKNSSEPKIIELGPMESRMLAGTREEVVPVDSKRGRERGLVKENEDLSIEDMVREERRTRGQLGGDSMRAAERIAKDSKFESDLDYMDDNAGKLAKQVHKSDISLKNIAVHEYQKLHQILDHCQLCYHEEKKPSPIAPVISLATRVYLTLPTEPELSEGGAVIVPIEHRTNLLECDDDEWEEIRNFMKCLTRMYYDQGRDVMFYENATSPQRRRHAAMQVVPLPYSLGKMARAFFREAILSSDEEWTQHQKLIDTALRSREGLGKQAFRRCIAKEMPYFHAWFDMDGGLGHIVEDSYKWPKGDLFAREVIGGMLDVETEVIRKQGRWHSNDKRVPSFNRRWKKFDWTRVLINE
ncbi:Pre-mRNA-splicing factor cwf19 [Erysiphe neolycopersici]|uniref:Pre-mRNA-splicing factor cwf19 n=1 Tax=Erysiphe neolycopersici TaxID=212602 RepID=A0A420HIE8_9PEZI|nr:Pre-mRNA-splicing factor cwf19 [Erysiphe neolycopersici]